jgi:hypothetical protein
MSRPSSLKRAAILALTILFTPVGFLQGQAKSGLDTSPGLTLFAFVV